MSASASPVSGEGQAEERPPTMIALVSVTLSHQSVDWTIWLISFGTGQERVINVHRVFTTGTPLTLAEQVI